MRRGSGWALVIVLFLIIVALSLLLWLIPTPAPPPPAGSTTAPPPAASPATTTPDTADQPLSARVVVSAPAQNATVQKTFTVTGEAPGPWYFEASFPVQVRDPSNAKVGSGIAQAQSDWMTTVQVPFTASVTVSGYSGPATLVLLRDNPSGLPENDDSVSIPIVVQ